MTEQGPIIQLKNITRQFESGTGEVTKILEGVNLKIERGSFNVIRGESGSGKTTLLRILGMLDTDFHGQYLFVDKSVSEQPDWYLDELRAGNIGFIFQEGRLFEHFTMRRNVEIPLELHGMHDPNTMGRLVREMEPTFFARELEDGKSPMNLSPSEASGGQRQRASIMRAIVNKPSIILADEPTASLHENLKGGVLKHLRELCNQGHTVIVVSHDEIFYETGRQLDLKKGVLQELDAGPDPVDDPLVSRLPDPKDKIYNGWKPRAPFHILLQQALRETFYRPIFLSLILVSLIVGVTQVSVFASVILGAQVYVNEKITQGSRLNRIQIKPKASDRGQSDRFPDRNIISDMPAVSEVVPRRATTTRVNVTDGSAKTFPVSGLHSDDPEYDLLSFLAGGPFSGSHDRPEVIVTASLLGEAFDTSGLENGTQSYADFIGRIVTVRINRYNRQRDLIAEVPVELAVQGVILNGEGGRQLYFPNTTLLIFDRLIRDRDGAYSLPDGAGIGAWPAQASIDEMADFPWEDSLHVYAHEVRDVLALFTSLSRIGFKPDSDIWDFKWALDIQDTAWRIFVPLLGLIIVSVAITVAANIFSSAKLRETEFALWRVLGMRRGDLVLSQVIAIVGSVGAGALAGLALGGILIDQTKAMLLARSQETAEATGEAVQDFDAIFAPVGDFFLPVIVAAVMIGVAAAIYPSIRTAKTDPAKVLKS